MHITGIDASGHGNNLGCAVGSYKLKKQLKCIKFPMNLNAIITIGFSMQMVIRRRTLFLEKFCALQSFARKTTSKAKCSELRGTVEMGDGRHGPLACRRILLPYLNPQALSLVLKNVLELVDFVRNQRIS